MATWIAFLRALNVGGRRLTNDDLAHGFMAAGMADVRPFLASGNVVFSATGTESAIVAQLEEGLERSLGYAVPTFLRSPKEIRGILTVDPFDDDADRPAGKPQVLFLVAAPPKTDARRAEGMMPDDEVLHVAGRNAHWWPQGGTLDSAVDWQEVGGVLGPSTMRTVNTVVRLEKKFL